MKGEKLSILVLFFEILVIVALHASKEDKLPVKTQDIANKARNMPARGSSKSQSILYFTFLK